MNCKNAILIYEKNKTFYNYKVRKNILQFMYPAKTNHSLKNYFMISMIFISWHFSMTSIVSVRDFVGHFYMMRLISLEQPAGMSHSLPILVKVGDSGDGIDPGTFITWKKLFDHRLHIWIIMVMKSISYIINHLMSSYQFSRKISSTFKDDNGQMNIFFTANNSNYCFSLCLC